MRRKEGKHPYTRRFLPPYIIPRSPLSCENLITLMQKSEHDARPDTGQACDALGCIDVRTARKHIDYVIASTRDKSMELAHLLSKLHSPMSASTPGINPLEGLEVLWNIFLGTLTGLFGSAVSSLAASFLWIAHTFCTGKTSTARVFFQPQARDTS